MLEKSFGISYFLKPTKIKNSAYRYVYLRITVNGNAKQLSTKRHWVADRWDQTAGRAIGSEEDTLELNAFLSTLAAKIHQTRSYLIETDKKITAEVLVNLITGRTEKRMLLELIAIHNKKMGSLIGKGYSENTLQRYKTTYKHVEEFITWKYQAGDLSIHALNYEFASDFIYWLRAVKNCANNSAIKYFGNVKKIVMECVKKEWLKSDPFINLKLIKDDITRTALTKQELKIIYNKSFKIDRLNSVKDIFVFSCYTGLSYCDIKNLRWPQIMDGIDDQPWVSIQRQKTGTPSKLPLLPQPLAIINKYKNHPRCIEGNYVLPVLTNQKMNSYLKEIADICAIDKVFTFHIARHTFATTITLNNGVPIETVSKMLGHKSIKQTQLYAKILDRKISEDMKSLRKKLS
jgi:site-specific recombinase XerD